LQVGNLDVASGEIFAIGGLSIFAVGGLSDVEGQRGLIDCRL
jgi:hypothetical protein